MAVRKSEDSGDAQSRSAFTVEGRASLQGFEPGAYEVPLRAFAFDAAGRLVGSGDVDEKGGYRFDVALREAADVDILVGPAVEADIARQAEAPVTRFTAKDWKKTETGFRITP